MKCLVGPKTISQQARFYVCSQRKCPLGSLLESYENNPLCLVEWEVAQI